MDSYLYDTGDIVICTKNPPNVHMEKDSFLIVIDRMYDHMTNNTIYTCMNKTNRNVFLLVEDELRPTTENEIMYFCTKTLIDGYCGSIKEDPEQYIKTKPYIYD